MYIVYILISLKDKKLYVGCTSNLNNRLKRHQDGHVPATQNRLPVELIHSEKFESKVQAFSRERFLKSLWAGRFKRKLKVDYLKSQNK